MFVYYYLILFLPLSYCKHLRRPNIVLLIADDLGWNDVGFHGSNQIPTPNIDALAYSGIILQNYYMSPLCTPSRAALMTGKYAIHTGLQHSVLYGTEPWGLPLTEKLLPQYLKGLGYQNHLVGKWHLGHFKKDYLPLNRGFDSHIGFWSGRIDLYDHIYMEGDIWGYDFRRGFSVAHDLFNKYATDIYTDEAIKVIQAHNGSLPLFLMVAHSAMHSGNPIEPIRAPDHIIAKFKDIEDYQRQKYAAVLTKLDESIGKIVDELHKTRLLENTIILFTTDNGGPAGGFNFNVASNYPLKGVKNTLWEGGVRGAGLLWSPLIQKKSRVAQQRIHIADWLPTLYSAIGGNLRKLKDIDGIDQWDSLSNDKESKRISLVHNIDDIWGSAAVTLNQWKIIKGTNYQGRWDDWYGPSGREGSYNLNAIKTNVTGMIMKKLNYLPNDETILQLRSDAVVDCPDELAVICKPLEAPCLFDIGNDPCERKNLANDKPEILEMMLNYLDQINSTAVPPIYKPPDSRGNFEHWGHVVTNYADYIIE